MVIGSPGVGRGEELLRRFVESNHPAEPRCLYLAAGLIRKRQLQTRFLERYPAAFEIPVVTFYELVQSLLKATSATRRGIDETEKLALVEEVLRAGRFRLLGGCAAGLLSQLSDFISFVKQHNIRDEDLLRLRYGKFGHEPSALEEELIQAFAAYQRLLDETEAEDVDGEQGRAYTALLTGEISLSDVWPEVGRIVVEGSHRMTPLQSGLVRLLMQDLEEATLSLPGVDAADPEMLPPEWVFLRDGSLQWVDVKPPHQRRITLCRPATREDEVLAAGCRILEIRTQDPKFSFASAAVACARIEAYEAHLDEIFPKLGIPFQTLGRRARSSASAAALVKYVRLALDDWDAGSLFDFLLNPQIQVPGLSGHDLHRIEATAVGAGIRGGLNSWTTELPAFARLLTENANPERQEPSQRMVRTCDALAQALSELRLEANKTQTPLQWRREVFEKLRPFWTAPAGLGMVRRRRENLTLRALLAELEKACAASRSPHLDLAGFAALLERQLEHSRADCDFEGDAVAVATPRELQQAEFDVVFWLGLIEGEFPDPRPRHIFFDEEVANPWGLSDREARLAEDRALFELVTGCARKEAALSCPLRVGDSPALPSPFWPDALQSPDNSDEPIQIFEQVAPTVRFALEPAAQENARRGRMVVGLRESGLLSPFQGILSDPAVLKRFRSDFFSESVDLSPSQIENYVRCGFRYFAQRVLAIARPAERDEGVSPLVRGALIHRVLHRFVSQDRERPENFEETTREQWRKRWLGRMSRLLERELERLKRERKWRDELFWEHEASLLAQGLDGEGEAGVLAEFVDQHWERLRAFETVGAEQRLGPLDLGIVGDLDLGRLVPVRLKGKIDRLDRGPHGLFVIDYKTGQDQRPRAYQGWGFQLPLYAWMAETALQEPVDGVAFYSVQPPRETLLKPLTARTGGESAASGLDKLVQYYRRKALQAAQRLYDGQFPITLLGRSRAGCRVCELRSACRFDRSQMDEIKKLGRFPADEPIVVRGRWVGQEEGEPSREKVPV